MNFSNINNVEFVWERFFFFFLFWNAIGVGTKELYFSLNYLVLLWIMTWQITEQKEGLCKIQDWERNGNGIDQDPAKGYLNMDRRERNLRFELTARVSPPNPNREIFVTSVGIGGDGMAYVWEKRSFLRTRDDAQIELDFYTITQEMYDSIFQFQAAFVVG